MIMSCPSDHSSSEKSWPGFDQGLGYGWQGHGPGSREPGREQKSVSSRSVVRFLTYSIPTKMNDCCCFWRSAQNDEVHRLGVVLFGSTSSRGEG